jgi:hypothetical protein
MSTLSFFSTFSKSASQRSTGIKACKGQPARNFFPPPPSFFANFESSHSNFLSLPIFYFACLSDFTQGVWLDSRVTRLGEFSQFGRFFKVENLYRIWANFCTEMVIS